MADLMETLRLACDDPMWANHVEMPKKLLRHAIDRLESLEAERALAERAGGVNVEALGRLRQKHEDGYRLAKSRTGRDKAKASIRVLDEVDAALTTEPAAPESQQEAARIGDAVLAWMIKYDLLDGEQEYYVADVIAVLDDLTPLTRPGGRT